MHKGIVNGFIREVKSFGEGLAAERIHQMTLGIEEDGPHVRILHLQPLTALVFHDLSLQTEAEGAQTIQMDRVVLCQFRLQHLAQGGEDSHDVGIREGTLIRNLLAHLVGTCNASGHGTNVCTLLLLAPLGSRSQLNTILNSHNIIV